MKPKIKKMTPITIRTSTANRLIRLKEVGDTYSDVIERLLDFHEENNRK